MAFYRKKPVIVEAVHCSTAHWAAGNDWKTLPRWLADAYERGDVLFASHPSRVEIKTLEGVMTAEITDLIIRGVRGELYPCKPDIFAATYEHVENETV